MTIQIIYAEIFHNVLRKIPGHIVDRWLCDLEASLWFLKFRPRVCFLLSFTCRHLIFREWSFILSFLDFSIPSGCSRNAAAEVKFQEESFWEDTPSVKGPADESSPLCKHRGAVCIVCIQTMYRIVSVSNLISGKWMPKNVQITVQLHSFHMLARLCSKSFKLGFSSPWT